MRIVFKGKYKSITDFESPEMENFCVITGPNGSGKTQLLELLNALQDKTELSIDHDSHNFQIKIDSDTYISGAVKHIHSNGLNPKSLGTIGKQSLERTKENIIRRLSDLKRNPGRVNFREKGTAENIAKFWGKDIRSLEKEDIYNYHLFSYEDLSNTDIFQLNLGQVFYHYAHARDRNNYHTYRNEKYGEDYKVLTKEEFDKKYVSPWELINRFLEKIKSDYQVEGISEESFNESVMLTPKFVHKNTGDQIDADVLSSGEKVMVSLAFCLFNIETGKDDIFPKMLLLDEPDASLHPTMTKEFLDVIYEELVIKKGVKVFLTTHSPSTIALTDEKYLYFMSRSGKRLTKTSKDKALGILTEGLNTISVKYENRRQVFVESNYDREFYEMIFRKVKKSLHKDISLHFISSGIDKIPVSEEVPDGDCYRVKNVVKELTREGGNNKVFGIIDWDAKNNPESNILVNGHKIRYSLENYIFAPLILAAFLLDCQIISREGLELENNENYTDLPELSASKLNSISDFICEKVKKHIKDRSLDYNPVAVEYINGKTIQIPKWYLEYPGHGLEELIIKAFPKLISEFGSKVNLPEIPSEITGEKKKIRFKNQLLKIVKSRVIKKTFDNVPELIPVELKDLLYEIQNK